MLVWSDVIHLNVSASWKNYKNKNRCSSRALDKIRGSTRWQFFPFLTKTTCCDPPSEPPWRDGPDGGPQHMSLCRINKNYPYHQIPPPTQSPVQPGRDNLICCSSSPKPPKWDSFSEEPQQIAPPRHKESHLKPSNPSGAPTTDIWLNVSSNQTLSMS